MAAIAAHEIRNPLGIIRGTVELMGERIGSSLSKRDQTAMNDILAEVERLRRLTEDFLDLSTDRPLGMGRVDVEEVLEEAARAAEASFPSIRFARQAGGPSCVEGDPGRLRQVFANLLANAAQAQGHGEVEVGTERLGTYVKVWVKDHGPGVPAEIQDRLFDPFVTTKSGGTGLGLAISRRLVERHGGTLLAVSTQMNGTIFEVRLPLMSNRMDHGPRSRFG
jgi:signal transduction histidine kinase